MRKGKKNDDNLIEGLKREEALGGYVTQISTAYTEIGMKTDSSVDWNGLPEIHQGIILESIFNQTSFQSHCLASPPVPRRFRINTSTVR